MMLGAAFTAFFASLITAGSHWAGMSLSAALRAGSALILVSAIYMLVTVPARLRRLDPAQAEAFSLIVSIAFGLGIAVNVVAQTIVVANVLPEFSRGLFLYGLVFNLGLAAFTLVRILFSRPGSE
jgi:hypothetical protein